MRTADLKVDPIILNSGLDLVTTSLEINPASAIDMKNYAPGISGGFERAAGFEVYDGRPSASDALYYILPCNISATINNGDTIVGESSAATGHIIKVNASDVVFTKATGTFLANERLLVSSVEKARTTGIAEYKGASTAKLDFEYYELAADIYRADITAVTGSGIIRGIWDYKGDRYAFRDNAGGTAGAMWKSTSTGWMAVSLGYEIGFNLGSVEIAEGMTITGNTSSATALVKRVLLRTGTWAGGDATGYMVIENITGTFANPEILRVGATHSAYSITSQQAITLPPGGRYEFINYNFTGSPDTLRIYGCNNVGTAFEFDGTVFAKIRTGMTIDVPKFITAHAGHLFLAFGGSLQHSSKNLPYQWTAITGAAQLGMGADVTGMIPVPQSSSISGALLVLTETKAAILNGTGIIDWVLSDYNNDIGAVPYTVQTVGTAIFTDNRGLFRFDQSVTAASFEMGAISRLVQPFIDKMRGTITASCIVRNKNQYRLFFSDGQCLVLNFYQDANGLTIRYGLYDYGMPVRCIVSATDSTGKEVIFFGSDDGKIYQADKGNTLNGTAMEYWVRLAFNHSKSPRIKKAYRRAIVEVASKGITTLKINADISYSDPGTPSSSIVTIENTGLGGYWDSAVWNEFFWDGMIVSPANVRLYGSGTNVSMLFYGNYKEPRHTINSIMLHYIARKVVR